MVTLKPSTRPVAAAVLAAKVNSDPRVKTGRALRKEEKLNCTF